MTSNQVELALDECESVLNSVRDLVPGLEGRWEDDLNYDDSKVDEDFEDGPDEPESAAAKELRMKLMQLELGTSSRLEEENSMLEAVPLSRTYTFPGTAPLPHQMLPVQSPKSDTDGLALLSQDDLALHGLVLAVQNDTRKGSEAELEEELFDVEEGYNVVEDASDVFLKDEEGEEGFIRIPVSDEEYWSLQEQVSAMNDIELQQGMDELDDEEAFEREEENLGFLEEEEEEEESCESEDGERDALDNDEEDDARGESCAQDETIVVSDSDENNLTLYEDDEEEGGQGMKEGEIEEEEEAQFDEATQLLDRALRAQQMSSVYDSFELKVIHERRRTGFEATKELKVYCGMVVAGRYEVKSVVGEAAFSTALRCYDLEADSQGSSKEAEVCIKVIKNNKDFFDQSLDEIRLLKYLNAAADPDEKRVVRMYDYFYHKEHLFIVTELLGKNLYSACKEELPLRGTSSPNRLFTMENIRSIALQALDALTYISSLGIIHCDLKPENILLKSLNPIQIKIIDFGSSCFTTDHLSSYIQSRFYRAPEVILGCKYDQRIDVWSLGCVLAELYSGQVLFEAMTASSLLAKIVSVLGPFTHSMIKSARFRSSFFLGDVLVENRGKGQGTDLLYPKRSCLAARLHAPSAHRGFVQFVRSLLIKNPVQRPSADFARAHPWLLGED